MADVPLQGSGVIGDRLGVDVSGATEAVERLRLFPRQTVADHCKGRLAFLVVLICYAAVDFERLQWVPLGMDTGENWHVFYASYAELFYHHDLAHWLPYNLYGQPKSVYHLVELTATDYLMMAMGKVVHIKNAVLLFQLSLMATHLIFLMGIHLLARSLFRRRSTVWLCLLGSITFLNGLNLPSILVFRMVSWYPLIMYFLVRFFREHRPEGLWLAGIVFIFSCLGDAYEQPHVVMAILPFVAVGTWKCPRAWLAIFCRRASNLATMVFFLALGTLYLWMAVHIMDGIGTVSPGRASGGVVPLDEFVTGRDNPVNPTLFRLVVSFFAGHCFYIGLLPFGCVLWGFLRARGPLFITFMVTALFVAWFSMGGLFAVAFYYSVPFISLMHYLWMGFYLIPVLLLLAAGAVWDVIAPSRKDLKCWLVFPVILFFLIDFCLYADHFALGTKNLQLFLSSCRLAFIKLAFYAGLLALAAILSLVLRSARQPFNRHWRGLTSFRSLATGALLTGLFLDVFQYSYRSGTPANPTLDSFRDEAPGTWEPVDKASPVYQACYVQPLTWQGARLDQPVDERKKVVLQPPFAFVNTYAFAQFDPCRSEFQLRAIGTAMQKLLALRDKDDPALQTILGCHAPKLRLMTQALYVNTEAEAEAAVRSHNDLANVVILQWPTNSPVFPMTRSVPAEGVGAVHVTDFGANAIEIQVNTTVPEGAWLVYADTYDPRWRAWVNGKPVPIVPAYVGLKAVWVPHGESVVRMKFAAWSNLGVRMLAAGGALCSLSLLLFCGICCIRGFPASCRKQSESTSNARAGTGCPGPDQPLNESTRPS